MPTLKSITKRAEFWCDILGVEDLWDVSIGISDGPEMTGNAGMNKLHAENQVSKIILAPNEGEHTLVHEILHIILDGHKDLSADTYKYDPMHERAINKIATALLKLANSKKKKPNVENKQGDSVLQRVKSIRTKRKR